MEIALVAAVAKNGVIGKNNDLPWRLPDDMRFFMEKTRGHHVILGRKNYESLKPKFRPLPDRTNIVLTRQKDFSAPGCIVVNTMGEALDVCRRNGENEAMVIGGSDIYALALPVAHRLYITEIDAEVEGDVFFPDYDKTQWKESRRIHHTQDDKHRFSFDIVTYERLK